MIHVECTYLNPENFMPMGSKLTKTFTEPGEFGKFYNIVKADPCVLISIMTYDPQVDPALKTSYENKLFMLNRNNPV